MSTKLPPTARDLEIYESVHIQNLSTWFIADRHHISQTRVRQIIRRIVEWLGEVMPPQTKLAKEQELHLARQIAADRFQHQLEEVAMLWQDTRESKYAGIRIRLTTAQARLGAVGGVAAGLAADAAEDIPVPAYQPLSEPNAVGRGTPDRAHVPTKGLDEETSAPEPVALTMPLDHAKFLYEFRHILIHPPHLANELEDAKCVLRAAGYQLPDDGDDQKKPIATEINGPPLGDFSTSSSNSVEIEATTNGRPIQNTNAAPTCDNNEANQPNQEVIATFTSQPLLTTRDPSPVIELQIAPEQPGAKVSQFNKSDPSTPRCIDASLSPCSPLP